MSEDFVRKHKPLTKKEIEEKFRESEAQKKQFATDAATLESEIDNFNKIVDPLINPATGKALCWIRRPTQGEWESMIPAEIIQYRNDPKGIPADIAKKYNDLTFKMMEKVIDNPKHDAEWWKEHSNLTFIQLFQMHLNSVLNELGLLAENF